VIDDYSRAAAGYCLGFESPSDCEPRLLYDRSSGAKAIHYWEICGISDILYSDNGSDFRSKQP
jgi:putative transposase